MSRHRPPHPVPRGGIDPISCADDALAVLALGAPYGHDTIVMLLDHRRRGTSVLVVTDTDDDALVRIIDVCVEACHDVPEVAAMILASSRPDGDARADDIQRWLEASERCRAGGLVLVEWFVLGRSGPQCPRELVGAPARWAARPWHSGLRHASTSLGRAQT